MTLPFNLEKGNRKYQCFVCGVMFNMLIDMKRHILTEHEEGREYILCPRCDYPVRDLRSHYKAVHKTHPPKNCQMKTIVWKDQKNPKKKHKKPTFKEGYIISKKNHGEAMHYRSGWECEVYRCLELMPEVISYKVEPLKIKYFEKGKVRHYWPDIMVNFNDGRTEIWEVKPANQTNLPNNQAKWEAAREYCGVRNWKFEVITEQVINKMKRG